MSRLAIARVDGREIKLVTRRKIKLVIKLVITRVHTLVTRRATASVSRRALRLTDRAVVMGSGSGIVHATTIATGIGIVHATMIATGIGIVMSTDALETIHAVMDGDATTTFATSNAVSVTSRNARVTGTVCSGVCIGTAKRISCSKLAGIASTAAATIVGSANAFATFANVERRVRVGRVEGRESTTIWHGALFREEVMGADGELMGSDGS